jgi:hypothetical protein
MRETKSNLHEGCCRIHLDCRRLVNRRSPREQNRVTEQPANVVEQHERSYGRTRDAICSYIKRLLTGFTLHDLIRSTPEEGVTRRGDRGSGTMLCEPISKRDGPSERSINCKECRCYARCHFTCMLCDALRSAERRLVYLQSTCLHVGASDRRPTSVHRAIDSDDAP